MGKKEERKRKDRKKIKKRERKEERRRGSPVFFYWSPAFEHARGSTSQEASWTALQEVGVLSYFG